MKSTAKIQDQVMRKIKKGEVKMLPRGYFVVMSWLLVAAIVILLVVSAILFSISAEEVRLASQIELAQFGSTGRSQFIAGLPWVLVFLAFAALTGLFWLLKKTEISYKVHFITIFLVVFLLLLALGSFSSAVGISNNVGRHPLLDRLRPMTRLVRKSRIVGVVVSVKDNKARLLADDDAQKIIVWDESTVFRHGNDIKVGDRVMAFGRLVKTENQISTYKVYGVSINPRRIPHVQGVMMQMP